MIDTKAASEELMAWHMPNTNRQLLQKKISAIIVPANGSSRLSL